MTTSPCQNGGGFVCYTECMAKWVLLTLATSLFLSLGYFIFEALFVRTPCLFMHTASYCDRP